tara:strand:- start:59 stop:814 length:756 start_codon:yes stop_codon:yes gene_type:complete
MTRFVISGPYRSGTTYLSCILNSQDNSSCVEMNIKELVVYDDLKKKIFFLNTLDNKFHMLPISPPDFINAKTDLDMKLMLEKKISNYFKTENIGFKQTMLITRDLEKLIDEGYKIIIMRRNLNEIFKSWTSRIDLNKTRSFYQLNQYLKNINFYNFPEKFKDNIYILDYNNLINDRDNVLKNLSLFLNFEIINPEKLYYSFNKNIKIFEKNSSFKYLKKDECFIEDELFIKKSNNLKYRLYSFYMLLRKLF